MNHTKRVVLAGGSGFLGSSLTQTLQAKGYDVVILTRGSSRQEAGITFLPWNGKTAGSWASSLEGASAVVNLTGKSVDCRYTEENRREIFSSRVSSVQALAEALAKTVASPQVWVQAASLAVYGDTGDRICDESSPHGEGFSVNVCEQWESSFRQAAPAGMRTVLLRIGFVLARDGGALKTLAGLTSCFLGGSVGNGKQYISWLHIDDFDRMVLEAIENPLWTGIFNATGPFPETNADFMRQLRRALRRPWSPPVPSLMVRAGARILGTEAELALTGRRCLPTRVRDLGFTFRYPQLPEALRHIYA